MTAPTDQVWRDPQVIARYLTGVRGGIPLAAEQIHTLVRLVRAAVPAPRRFLDLGCGNGVLGRALLAEWPTAEGLFVDFAEPMLAACRDGLGSDAWRHACCCEDYGTPKWVDASAALAPFDVVVSGYSIHHQEDNRKQELYREIFGLLAPGGLFLNLEHVASASAWGETVFDGCFLDALVEFHARSATGKGRDAIEQEYYRRADKAANRLASVELQCQWLREIGFERVDCYFKLFELALFGGIRPAVNLSVTRAEAGASRL